jgi:hypothetical protein
MRKAGNKWELAKVGHVEKMLGVSNAIIFNKDILILTTLAQAKNNVIIQV